MCSNSERWFSEFSLHVVHLHKDKCDLIISYQSLNIKYVTVEPVNTKYVPSNL